MNALISALRNREFKKALTLVQVALKKSPEDQQLWAMLGTAYSGTGHRKEALNSFRTALRISPDYVPALRGAAQIEYDSGSQEAVPVLKHVLRLQPADSTAHAMLAVLEYRQGNCVAAAEHFEKSGAMLDSELPALHAYATCLVRLKRLDEAAQVFLRAVNLQPEDPQQRRLLAHKAWRCVGDLVLSGSNARNLSTGLEMSRWGEGRRVYCFDVRRRRRSLRRPSRSGSSPRCSCSARRSSRCSSWECRSQPADPPA